MKKKVHKLTGLDKTTFRLIGISCHESDYRLSWAINSQLGFSFKKAENHTISHPISGEKMEFTMFSCTIQESSLKYNLISNRCQNGFLIEKLKNIDFLLQVFGELENDDIKKIVSSVKGIDLVSAAFALSNNESDRYSHLMPSE